MRWTRFLFLALVLIAGPPPVRAQQSGYYGSEAAMTAASGMALVTGGGAAWYNPAGLGGVRRSRLDLSGTVFLLRLRPMNGVVTIDLPSGSYGAKPDANQLLALPSALVFTRGLKKSVTLGLGIFVTTLDQYSLSSTLDREEVDPDTSLRYRYIQRSTVDHSSQTYHVGPVVGWQVNRCFRLGWALFVVYNQYKNNFGFVLEAHDQENDPPEARVSAAEDYRQSSWNIALQATMGLQWEVAPGWHLGLLVRTPTMAFWHSNRISSLSSGLFATQSSGFTGSFALTEPRGQGAGFGLVAPAQITAGIAYRHPRFWIGLEADFVLPLRTEELGIDVGFQWNLRAGSRIFLARRWSLGIGAFTDRSFEPAPDFPTDSAMHYYGFATGFRWQRAYQVVGRDRKLIFATTVALRYAIGIGDILTFRFGEDEGAAFNLVDSRFHEVGVFIGSTLYF